MRGERGEPAGVAHPADHGFGPGGGACAGARASGDARGRGEANDGRARPVSLVDMPGGYAARPEPGSAVATGILGVHAGDFGAFVYRNAPPPQRALRDQTALFTLLQSHAGDRTRGTRGHGSKLRLRVTWARKTSRLGLGRPTPPHPAPPPRPLVCNRRFGGGDAASLAGADAAGTSGRRFLTSV